MKEFWKWFNEKHGRKHTFVGIDYIEFNGIDTVIELKDLPRQMLIGYLLEYQEEVLFHNPNSTEKRVQYLTTAIDFVETI